MPVNISKSRQPRFWSKWKNAGSVTILNPKRIRITNDEYMRNFNRAMYGISHPVHSYEHGYLDPGNRYHKRFLDP